MGLGALLRRWRTGLLAILLVGLLTLSCLPAWASVHTYHERPGQTTYRSQQSLRDQKDRAWQATLFKRYVGGDWQGIYLRLVGFPGSATVNANQPLVVDTGAGLRWEAPSSLDPQTQLLPENVGQYDFESVLKDLSGAIPLRLEIPLQRRNTARLTAAPFVVEEWRSLRDLDTASPEPG
ncbi:MAG TPA: DUF3122 domain-containing protein [Leptolyngbyaceae cyanobacterium]